MPWRDVGSTTCGRGGDSRPGKHTKNYGKIHHFSWEYSWYQRRRRRRQARTSLQHNRQIKTWLRWRWCYLPWQQRVQEYPSAICAASFWKASSATSKWRFNLGSPENAVARWSQVDCNAKQPFTWLSGWSPRCRGILSESWTLRGNLDVARRKIQTHSKGFIWSCQRGRFFCLLTIIKHYLPSLAIYIKLVIPSMSHEIIINNDPLLTIIDNY